MRYALNVFHRQPTKPTTISEGEQLVSFIRDERRRELCFENHRWFDLRRYGMEEIKHTWYDTSGEPIEYILEKKMTRIYTSITE